MMSMSGRCMKRNQPTGLALRVASCCLGMPVTLFYRMGIIIAPAHRLTHLSNAGQGGGMALEDAMTIAECLERAEVLEDVPRLMRAYQVIREPRCRIMQQRGLIMNQVMRMPNGPAQEARDEVMRKQSDMFLDVPWDGEHIDQLPDSVNAPGFVNWQNGHDANLFVCRSVLTLVEKPVLT